MFNKWFKSAPPIEFSVVGLPTNIMELTGTKVNGPNCYNATMLFFEPNRHVRYIAPEEMVHWIESHTQPDPYKMCAVGSIIALYEDELLIHTAVFVAPGVLWHKRGCGGHWEFVTEKQLRRIYFETTRYEYRLFSETTK